MRRRSNTRLAIQIAEDGAVTAHDPATDTDYHWIVLPESVMAQAVDFVAAVMRLIHSEEAAAALTTAMHETNGGYNADQPGYVPPPELLDEHPEDRYGDRDDDARDARERRALAQELRAEFGRVAGEDE
jgi:hypothetical protein